MIKKRKYILLSAIFGAALLLTGCGAGMQSSTFQQQIDEVRATADEALRTANTADYQAHIAKNMADEALSNQHRMMKKRGMKSMMK